MSITVENVKHVAKLAKLSFDDAQIESFTSQLSDIIDMVEQLSEVDTTDVPVTTHGYEIVNVFREDLVEQGMSREELFKNVPTHENHFIKVPAMLDGGGDA